MHLLPNAIASSTGSLFAGWIMSRTGKYKTLSNIFGIVPTLAAIGIALMHSATPEWLQWVSIMPLGFGNAVVFQTTLIALLASVGSSQVAVATGFAGLFRCIGQVCGVAFGAAIFQSLLFAQLRERITGPDALDIIGQIRHDAKIVKTLPPELKEEARKSYAYALRTVFIFCAICTFISFLVRLPMPEHSLDEPPTASRPGSPDSDSEDEDKSDVEDDEEAHVGEAADTSTPTGPTPSMPSTRPMRPKVRRFSTYETGDGFAYPAPRRPKLPHRSKATRTVPERPAGGRSRSRIREHHDGRGVIEEEEEMAFSLPTAEPMFAQEREGMHIPHRRTGSAERGGGNAHGHGHGYGESDGEGSVGSPVDERGHPMAFSLPPPSPAAEDWANESHHHHFYEEEHGGHVHWLPEVESREDEEAVAEEDEEEDDGEDTPTVATASPTSYFVEGRR